MVYYYVTLHTLYANTHPTAALPRMNWDRLHRLPLNTPKAAPDPPTIKSRIEEFISIYISINMK